MEPLKYVYSFNRGALIEKALTFVTEESGDQGYGDQILFSMTGNCSRVDFTDNDKYVLY